ncbi:hypothetical protein [Pseudomonas syringae]
MIKENRIYFESELLKELKGIEGSEVSIKILKSGIRFIYEKKVVAELDFQYLVKSNAYVLNGRVFGGPIFDCSSKIEPPYKSHLFSDACFAFTTSGKQDKKFSDNVYGSIYLPPPEEVGSMCKRIRSSLENYYIPMIMGCIAPSTRTIEDVLHSPTDYAYPAVFIHCAVACNPELVTEEVVERIKTNKKIIRNKSFDLKLLEGVLGPLGGGQDFS